MASRGVPGGRPPGLALTSSDWQLLTVLPGKMGYAAGGGTRGMSPARQCPRGCPVQEEYSALSYDARSITVLEGLEAARKPPGLYIGSTGEGALPHPVPEGVDHTPGEGLAALCDRV